MKPPRVLHSDPTLLTGPRRVTTLPGRSKALRFVVDATDEFFSSGRGLLTVTCSHPDIEAEDIAVGPARNGRIRVIVTVPAEAQLGDFAVTAGIYAWERAAGGLGYDLEWKTTFTVAAEIAPPTPPQPTARNKDRMSQGPEVALLWRHGERIGLLPTNPGKIDEVPRRRSRKTSSTASLPRSASHRS